MPSPASSAADAVTDIPDTDLGADMTTTTYAVTGMTCGHCVSAVTDELMSLDGVSAVDVDLHAGGTSPVTVSSAAPLDDTAVRAAVDEAGYALEGSTP